MEDKTSKVEKSKSKFLTIVLFLVGLLFLFIGAIFIRGNIAYGGSPVFKSFILSIIFLPLSVLFFSMTVYRIYKHFKSNPIFSGIFIFLISATLIFIGFYVIKVSSGGGFVLRWILMILGATILFIPIPYLAYKQFNTNPIFSCFLIGLILSSLFSFIVIGIITGIPVSRDALARAARDFAAFIYSFMIFVVVSIISIIVGGVIKKRRKE